MTNMIIFYVFLAILYIALAGGVGLYINSEKGHNKWIGFAIGAIFPVVGHVVLATSPTSDKVIVEQMYSRNMLTLSEFKEIDATLEIKIKEAKNSNHK